VYGIKKLKSGQGPRGCRAIDKEEDKEKKEEKEKEKEKKKKN
jgi:hypothetical protein